MPPQTRPAPADGPSAGPQREPGRRRLGSRPADPVAWLIAFGVFAAYTVLSVSRYRRLDPGSWDLGIYTEYVKAFAHLQPPVVLIRGFNLFGDHFTPIVAVLAPFFRMFPTPVTLLVAQALLTAVSVLPVCRAARELLGAWPSRAIGAAYGFSWGLVQMVNFDFHEVAFAVPLLAFALSALLRGRPLAAAAWALPLVLVKEDQGFTVAALGLVMAGAAGWAALAGEGAGPAWLRRRPGGSGERAPAPPRAWAAAGGLLVLWGLAWSALAILVIIPHFNPAHQYPYWSKGGVLSPGGHPSVSGVIAQLSVSAPAKARTLALVLAPTAFLALGSPLALAAAPSLLLRFVSTNPYFWGDGYHYSATVMPVVFLAAVDVLARWQGRRRAAVPAGAGAMLVLAAVLAHWFPLTQLWQPSTYTITAHVRAEYAAMARVPPGVTVESTLTMLATLAARDPAYWVGSPGDRAPRYIVWDADNSGYSPPPADLAGFVSQQHPGMVYRKIFQASDVYVYRLAGRTSW